jgi:hypothetical protein
MSGMLWQLYKTVMREVNHWDTQQWLIVFAIAVTIGVVALRGFGSRANY